MAHGEKSRAILQGLVSGGPWGAAIAGGVGSFSGDGVLSDFVSGGSLHQAAILHADPTPQPSTLSSTLSETGTSAAAPVYVPFPVYQYAQPVPAVSQIGPMQVAPTPLPLSTLPARLSYSLGSNPELLLIGGALLLALLLR